MLREQIHAYETAKDLNLKDLTDGAKSAVQTLSRELAQMNQLNELKEKNSKLEEKVSDRSRLIESLNSEIADKTRTIDALDSQLKSLFSEYQQFFLKAGQVRKIFEGKFIFSVTYVTSNGADTILNNEQNRLNIGQYLDLSNGSRKCKITLEGVEEWKSAHFSVLCDKT